MDRRREGGVLETGKQNETGRVTGFGWWHTAVVLLVALGPALALLVTKKVRAHEEEALEVREEQVLTEIEVHFKSALRGLAEQLYNIRGLYDASDLVNRDEFAVFTDQVLARNPHIQALEWAPRVRSEEITAWFQSTSSSGLDTDWSRIKNRLDKSTRSDSRDRFLVTYLNPVEGNEQAIGFDLTSELRRRTTIEKALSTGDLCFTPPIGLVQGDDASDVGTLAILPCDAGPDVPPHPSLLVAVFKYKDIFGPVLESSSSTSREYFDVRVRDRADQDRLVFRSFDSAQNSGQVQGGSWIERPLNFGGRRFVLEGRMKSAFEARYAEGSPQLSGLSAMIGYWLMLGMAFRGIGAVRRRSEESRNRIIRSVLESLYEGVLITDTEGKLRYANRSAVRLLGESAIAGDGLCLSGLSFLRADRRTPVLEEELPFNRAASGKSVELERLLLRRDIEPYERWISVTGGPILDADAVHTGGVCVLRDITDRIHNEEQESELSLAREVQEMLFPTSMGEGTSLEVSGYTQPAGSTSGDYYDFIDQDDGSVILIVCDISGHGLGPALIMAEVRAMLLTMLHTTRDLSLVMGSLNQSLCQDLPDGCFVTMLLARLTPGAGRLEYVNAGHPPLVVFDPTGQVRHRLGNTSVALGITPEATFDLPPSIPLEDGDLLLLFTDGLDEAQNSNGELLGQERLEKTIAEACSSSTDELLTEVRDLAGSFNQDSGQGDDQTVLLCRIRRAAGEVVQAT